MPIVLNRITIMTTDFSRSIDWSSEVLGAEVDKLHVEVEGFGLDAETPGSIPVLISTRPPSLELGVSSIPVPVSVDVSFWTSEANGLWPGKMLFRTSIDLAPLGIGGGAAAGITKVATLVRPIEASLGPPTSEGKLRVGLASGTWSPRGRAVQRPQVDPGNGAPLPGGAMADETPDAFRLLKYGGVEVLEARISPLAPGGLVGVVLAAKALVRSPANIIYYSGHGLYASRCLAVHQNPVPTGHSAYAAWAKASDLKPGWSGLLNPNTLIIAGCSILSIEVAANPQVGPGLDWLPLLRSRGGPLFNLLGYGSVLHDPQSNPALLQAPKDDPVGDAIAQEIGQKIASGSNVLVRDWLEINAAHRAWNAVAIDGSGVYWHVTQDLPWTTTYAIHSTQLP
ncbi:hypothetical protein [Pseudoxanthomonas putridarboris]|uniref:Gingipain domain-containing protein n=1 Tax=Pseudoxanthomonas putridarboris TaxID=752605 RepID=A0ABU9J231_9GAMM